MYLSIRFCCILLLPLLMGLSAQAAGQSRQRDFNAHNYQPRGAVNSLPAPRQQPKTRPVKTPSETTQPVQSVNWHWNSHSFSSSNKLASGSKGVFHYRQIKGRIDTSRICDNHGKGSMLYRDCRKAAKAYFKQQCSSRFKAACVAAGMTP